ncbi:MAG: hypothetical protein H0U36_08010 [Nocardioidaceae bacterium]|nr:hypothetical protein [Nocardioidaceae bacterium]
MTKQILAEGVLAGRADMRKIRAPDDLHAWMVERGTAMAEQLRLGGWTVAGDLDDLLPSAQPTGGTRPDDVDDAAVATVAVETVARLLFEREDTLQLMAQQRTLASELEKRAARVDELRDELKREQTEREWERRHPVRGQTRRVTRKVRRHLTRGSGAG